MQKDQYTGEWLYHGKWYDHYPQEEIEKYEAAKEDFENEKKERFKIDKGDNHV